MIGSASFINSATRRSMIRSRAGSASCSNCISRAVATIRASSR